MEAAAAHLPRGSGHLLGVRHGGDGRHGAGASHCQSGNETSLHAHTYVQVIIKHTYVRTKYCAHVVRYVGAYTSATVLGLLSCRCISISNTIAVQSKRFSAAAYSTRGINGEQVPSAVDTIAVVYGRRASGPAAVVLRLSR